MEGFTPASGKKGKNLHLPPVALSGCRLLLAALALCLPLAAQAQSAVSLPDVTMIVSGTLTQSGDGKVIPTEGDTLTLLNQKTLVTEASATVGSDGYALIISKPPSFNNTVLIFRLAHAGRVYPMLYSSGGPAAFAFNGALLPSRTVLNLVASSTAINTGTGTGTGTGAGTGTGTGTGTGSSTGTGTGTPTGAGAGASTSGGIDANGDGKIDEDDIGYLKRAISGQIPVIKATMDANGDGVVNSRDLIDLIRAVRTKSPTAVATAVATGVSAPVGGSTTSARIEAIRAERSGSRLNTQNLK